ncbi:hypothetical protein ABTZ93_44320 [Streptomyces sp. NPDC097941]|uniref:hypothetical protein n=1 Tax=Streptomyces sp. NPDC097941 TaxID=3155685 RepID=UPI0033334357
MTVGYGEAQAGVVAVADGHAVGVSALGVEPVDEFFGLWSGGDLDRSGAGCGGEAGRELFARQAAGGLDAVVVPGNVLVGNPCDPAGNSLRVSVLRRGTAHRYHPCGTGIFSTGLCRSLV